MSYFLLCFQLLPTHLLLSEAHLKVESSFLPRGSCLTHTSHLCGCCLHQPCLVGDSRAQFPKTCVYICAVWETLLRGAVRNKVKRREESQTCSFSYCNLLFSGLFHPLILWQSTFPSPCFWLGTSLHHSLPIPCDMTHSFVFVRTFLAYSHLTYCSSWPLNPALLVPLSLGRGENI